MYVCCRKFRKSVSRENSTVKISDEVPRDIPQTIHAVNFSAGLNPEFRNNLLGDGGERKGDPTMRYVVFTDTLRLHWF